MNDIQISKLIVHRGSFTLGPLDLHFKTQGLNLVLGPNGSGKTTLLRALMRRSRLESGEIDAIQLPVMSVGVEPLLFDSFSVEQNLRYFHTLHNQEFVESNYSELKKVWTREFQHLSAGWKRQTELYLALTLKTPTLLLDEPLAPLDEKHRNIFSKKIASEAKSDRLVITTTHDTDFFKESISTTVTL